MIGRRMPYWKDSASGKLFLYNNGNEYAAVTGGWSRYYTTSKVGSSYYYNGMTLATKNANNISINISGVRKVQSAITYNLIDITEYSKLYVLTNVMSVGRGFGANITKDASNIDSNTKQVLTSVTGVQTLLMDLSSTTGSYYVAIYSWIWGETNMTDTSETTQIWIEK